ncbi:hypothetical protein GF340_01330 [Candidatus Peregrinibacteria bacterium]|nr:hypothetical protein [Candidatus Peregrinibacteria bacterium]
MSKIYIKKALKILAEDVQKREEFLMESYLKGGVQSIKMNLISQQENTLSYVFDYLVFKKGLIELCVKAYADFFVDFMANHGPQKMREILNIEASKYDLVFEKIMDHIGIANGALNKYFDQNALEINSMLKRGKGSEIRAYLGISSKKYNGAWIEMLEKMNDVLMREYQKDTMREMGLKAFALLYAGMREQRSLRSFRKMWEFI